MMICKKCQSQMKFSYLLNQWYCTKCEVADKDNKIRKIAIKHINLIKAMKE